MKKEYTKPLMVDLNEYTGYGACSSGSGDAACTNGNIAGSACTNGTTGFQRSVINCADGSANSVDCLSGGDHQSP
jgi:hypothetical protein